MSSILIKIIIEMRSKLNDVCPTHKHGKIRRERK